MTANWPIPLVIPGSRRTATRVTPGAISLSNSGHFPHRVYSNCIKPVALPPGRDRLWTKPEPIGSGTTAKTTGMVRVAFSINSAPMPVARITSGASATISSAYLRVSGSLPATPANHDLNVPSVCSTQLLKRFQKCHVAFLSAGRVFWYWHQDSDTTKQLTLCARGKRPRRSHATEQRNELTPPHLFPSGRELHPTTLPVRLFITANSGG